MIAAWTCPRPSPGWWTRPAPRPAPTGSWPGSATRCADAAPAPAPAGFWAGLGAGLRPGGLPLAGGALTLAVPHPIIARRTWLWRAETGAVIEALGFAGGTLSQAGRDWLAGLGPVQENTIAPGLA